MNRIILKIAIILVFFSLAGETSAALWKYHDTCVVSKDENDDNDTQKEEKGKETVKEKFFQAFTSYKANGFSLRIRALNIVHIKYTAYLSLPEIPPEQA